MSEETQKCPYCGKEILKIAKKCKYCKEWLEEESLKEDKLPESNSQKSIEEASDSWQTILWKVGLAIIGAIILSILFPHAFDSKIILTNELTGQKITIPVKTTRVNGKDEFCITVDVLEGDEHTFCSMNKDSLTEFILKVKEREMRTKAEMQIKGQDISKETTKFFSLDKMIYEPYKQKYNIYEHNDTKNEPSYSNENLAEEIPDYEYDENLKAEAVKVGVSTKCLYYKRTGAGDNNSCTNDEAKKADKYLMQSEDDEYYYPEEKNTTTNIHSNSVPANKPLTSNTQKNTSINKQGIQSNQIQTQTVQKTQPKNQDIDDFMN